MPNPVLCTKLVKQFVFLVPSIVFIQFFESGFEYYIIYMILRGHVKEVFKITIYSDG